MPPIKYIKPKLRVRVGDVYTTVYGRGCYCGALNIDEDDILSALEYSKSKVNELN
jgi:hypothetical protein